MVLAPGLYTCGCEVFCDIATIVVFFHDHAQVSRSSSYELSETPAVLLPACEWFTIKMSMLPTQLVRRTLEHASGSSFITRVAFALGVFPI